MWPGFRWRWPLMVFGGIVVGAAMQTMTVWSMLRWTDLRTESLLAASESRHHRIVGELKRAIIDAVQSESKELSRVRIRLRTDEHRVSPPFGIWRVSLARIDEDGSARPPVSGSPTEGDIDFGYRPVGRYSLKIEDGSRWRLEQTIDLWPGAAFDRVIQVPPNLTPTHQAQLVWNQAAQFPSTGTFAGSRPVYAVCELRPQKITLNGWTWQPTVDHPVFALLGGEQNVDRDLLLEEYVAQFGGEFPADDLPTLLPDGTTAFQIRSGAYRLVSLTLCDRGDSIEPQRGLVPRVAWTEPDRREPYPAGAAVTVVRGDQPLEWRLTGRDAVDRMPLSLPPELLKAAGDRRVGQGADMAGDRSRNREGPLSPNGLKGILP